ncbi:MAG: glycosyltransferase [Lachnospiraceae bacterium]|nr:glycosyltransferase [Lachnospiraceae bacterium]
MKISVILTSYNHEKFIAQSIESVLNQTYQDFEFIIVDDCSTDSSWEIISRYKEKYPQIKVIRHDYNWHGGTVEDTIRNYATGDYIALHHSDDVWDENKLQMQITEMENNPGCAAVFTNAKAIDDNGEDYSDENGFYYNLFQVENRSRYEWLNYFFYNGNCLCHPSILIRKDIYEEDGFFRKGLRQIPDFVKWIQVCRKHEIRVLAEPLVKFRVHEAGKNASGMRAETQIRSTIELYLMLEEYAKIKEYDEFISVFPEETEYCVKDFFIPEYALGRICTKPNLQPYTRIYGISLLYQVLNDSAKADVIKNVYHYTMQDFMDENGKYDIFGILPEAFEQQRSIYVDTGNGFNTDEVYHQKFTLGDSEIVDWKCEIKVESGKQIRRLRFDPAESVMIKNTIISITINGNKVECIPTNALVKKDGKDIFVSLDPIYEIEMHGEFQKDEQIVLSIVGEIERLTDDEIANVVSDMVYEKRDAIYECQAKLLEKENVIREYQTNLLEKENVIQEERVNLLKKEEELREAFCVQRNLQAEFDCITREHDELLNAYNNMVNQNTELTEKYHQLVDELEEIKQHWMYRVFKKHGCKEEKQT